MKHFFFILSFFTILNSQISAQPGWFQLNSDLENSFIKMKFINENTGYAISNKKVFKTNDGGLTWESKFTAPGEMFLHSMFVVDENNIHVCGGEFIVMYDVGRSYKSVDGGNSWTLFFSGMGSDFQDIFFVNQSTGYMVSGHTEFAMVSNGHIYKSTNEGSSWIRINNDSASTQYTFYSKVFFLNDQTGWVGGVFTPDAGDGAYRLLKTSNGGSNWFYQINDTTGSFEFGDLKFFNDGHGFAYKSVYKNPQLLMTTDFGETWTEKNLEANNFHFVNKDTGWILNWDKQILKTVDGGYNWTHQFTSSHGLWSMDFINSMTGYVSGYLYQTNPVLYKTITGGVTSISQIGNSIPTEFSLSQNYPNPFNPVTNIKFSIPKSSFVALKVFNIAGKEIATLVNESLTAGEYNYEFQITNYEMGSGVYFFQLRAGDVVQTKKMILKK